MAGLKSLLFKHSRRRQRGRCAGGRRHQQDPVVTVRVKQQPIARPLLSGQSSVARCSCLRTITHHCCLLRTRRTGNSNMSATKKTVHFAVEGFSPISNAHAVMLRLADNEKCAGVISPMQPPLPLPNSLYHQKHSPPFRTGGRGSKQLSKAIQHSWSEKTNSDGTAPEKSSVFVLHVGDPLYFAKVISVNSKDPHMILVQRMQPSHIDPALLSPWEGHLLLVKVEYLHRIQVFQIGIISMVTHFCPCLDEKRARRMENIGNPSYP
jgi:hypothetical protein